MRKDRTLAMVAARVTVFAVIFFTLGWITSGLFYWLAGGLAAPTFSILVSAFAATWLCMRVYDDGAWPDVGLWWNASSRANLKWGVLGGCGAAALTLGLPLLAGAAHIVRSHAPSGEGIVFALVCIAAGSVGEEILFRGYGLQILMRRVGAWGAAVPVGVLFGFMHSGNPDASPLGLVNTAAFGVLFGYAYMRSGDLWLPSGLHFGWNLTLPLLGADLSGLKIFKEITGHEMVWRAGTIWSGGAYGPEASILTSAVLIPLAWFVWKMPIRRQMSPLVDLPAEALCHDTPQLPQS